MLNKKIVGLDISDYSIEVVEMERDGFDEKIIAYNRSIIEPGIVERGIIKNKKKLATIILQTLASAKPQSITTNQIVFGLPESRIFLHFFSFDSNETENLTEKIKTEALGVIPIAEDDMVLAYKEIKRADNKEEISKDMVVIATSRQILNDWEQFFDSINLSLLFFDIESLASFRGLYDELPVRPICLVDLGAETIGLSIFSSAGLEYNYQMQYGGKYLSAKLASGLKIDLLQADNLKKEISLAEGEKNISAQEILRTAFTHVSEEIKRNIEYFLKKYPKYNSVEKIILIGGSSKFRGLTYFFKKNGLEAVTYEKTELKYHELGIEYLEAIGLGRRFFNGYWQNDPVFVVGKINFFNKISFFKSINFDVFIKLIKKKKLIISGFLVIFAFAIFYLLFGRGGGSVKTKLPAKINSPEIVNEENNFNISDKNEPIVVEVVKKIKVQDIGSNLNVRLSPDKTSGIATQVKPGSVYAIMGEKQGWFKIEYEKGKFGWVVSEYVDMVSDK